MKEVVKLIISPIIVELKDADKVSKITLINWIVVNK